MKFDETEKNKIKINKLIIMKSKSRKFISIQNEFRSK